jgi:hypothetical protein
MKLKRNTGNNGKSKRRFPGKIDIRINKELLKISAGCFETTVQVMGIVFGGLRPPRRGGKKSRKRCKTLLTNKKGAKLAPIEQKLFKIP